MCVSTTGAIAFNWFSSISATTTFFAWMVGQDFENSQTQRANSFDCRLSRSRTGACTVPSKCKVIVHLRCPMHSRIVFGLWSPSFSSSPPYSHSSVPSTYPSCQMKVLHLQAISSRQCSASPCLSSLISGTSCGLEQASRTPWQRICKVEGGLWMRRNMRSWINIIASRCGRGSWAMSDSKKVRQERNFNDHVKTCGLESYLTNGSVTVHCKCKQDWLFVAISGWTATCNRKWKRNEQSSEAWLDVEI